MTTIAVAGGTGGLGRTVVEAIANAGTHNAIILSRTETNVAQSDNVKRLAVDYSNIEQIKNVLTANKVAVVVSCLVLADDNSAQSQINLIRAAALSGTVDRFIPTEYYLDFNNPIPGCDLVLGNFQPKAEQELAKHPQMTFTLIRAGIFMDHLGMPYDPIKTCGAAFWVFFDMAHEKCVFPGDGSYPLVLTHSTDVAKYIERLAGTPASKWPRESLIAVNKLEVKDLVPIIHKVTGKKIQVTYDPEKAVRRGDITQLPSNGVVMEDPISGETYRQIEKHIMLSMFSRAHVLPGRDLAELFPDVETVDLESFLAEAWARKQGTAAA